MSGALPSSRATGGHRAITVAALVAIYLQAVNISLPNAALPHIQGTLSMSLDEVGWVFTAYMAASAVTMPLTRWLAGRFGRKAVFQFAIAGFALGLVLDTLASTPGQFVFARIFQGPRVARWPPWPWRSCSMCCRPLAMPGSICWAR